MSHIRLDSHSALIVVDLQNAIAAAPFVHQLDGVVSRSVMLVDAFRAARRPVVLVNADGLAPGRTDAGTPTLDFPGDWSALLPEFAPQPWDILVTKRTWSAFARTGLEDMLRMRDVSQVVLAGVATSLGVESTAREAYGLGFNVMLAVDAMTDVDREAHHNSLERIFPRLGERASATSIAEALKV